MKLIKFLPLLFIFSCSTPETQTTTTKSCDCERKFYLFTPAMNGPNGQVLVPAKYNYVTSQFGSFDCVTTSGYVSAVGTNYTHQITTCK